jgi:hypothetical protein
MISLYGFIYKYASHNIQLQTRPLHLDGQSQLAVYRGVLLGAEGGKNVVEAIETTTDAAMAIDCA